MFCDLLVNKISTTSNDMRMLHRDGRANAVVDRVMTSDEVKFRIRSATSSYLQGFRVLLDVITSIPSYKVQWPYDTINSEKESDLIVNAISDTYRQVHQSASCLLSETTRVSFGLVGEQMVVRDQVLYDQAVASSQPHVDHVTPCKTPGHGQSLNSTPEQIEQHGTKRGVKRKRGTSQEPRPVKRRKLMEEESRYRGVKRKRNMSEESSRLMARQSKIPRLN